MALLCSALHCADDTRNCSERAVSCLIAVLRNHCLPRKILTPSGTVLRSFEQKSAGKRLCVQCECVCCGSTNLGRTQAGYPSSPEPTVTTLSCRNLGEITQAEGAASVLEAGLFKGGEGGGDFFWACKFEVVVPHIFHTPHFEEPTIFKQSTSLKFHG